MFLDSRRTFLKNSFLSTAILVLSCSSVYGAVSPLKTINLVQEDLFPFTKTHSVNTASYIQIILNHSHVNDDEKNFIRNGVQWLNEEAVDKYGKTYTHLDSKQRQNILEIISKENWGESWIESMLSYIMEAIFSDRVYGVNPNQTGQRWLNHSNGLPRPTKAFL